MCLKKEAVCEEPVKQHLPYSQVTQYPLTQSYFPHITYREIKLIFIVYFLCILLECELREKRDFL